MSYSPDAPQGQYSPDTPQAQPAATYPPGAVGADTSRGPSGPRAGFGRRLVALLIDGILMSIVSGFVAEALGYDVFQETRSADGGTFYGMYFNGGAFFVRMAIEGLYVAALEGSRRGQTLGKRLLGIRVMQLQTGEPLGFPRAVGRYLAKYLSALPLFLGFLWALWDRENQTWHDKLAGSVVVPVANYPVDRA